MTTETRRIDYDDLDDIAPLFDAYRVFYDQASDLGRARDFLKARLLAKDSHLIGAYVEGQLVGFTQLYPSFSSVRMCRHWILNDLYVMPEARQKGIAKTLLDSAAQHSLETGARSMVLSTKKDNTSAQRVYVANGWVQEETFIYYNFSV